MSIFDRIGNLARGKWLESTHGGTEEALRQAALEEELARHAQVTRPKSAPPRREPPAAEPQRPETPKAPIELDEDGHVKRTL